MGQVVFDDLKNTTYTIKTSLEGYRDNSVGVALTDSDVTETIVLDLMPFVETPLGMMVISVGILAIVVIAVFIVLRRKNKIRATLKYFHRSC